MMSKSLYLRHSGRERVAILLCLTDQKLFLALQLPHLGPERLELILPAFPVNQAQVKRAVT